MDRRTMAETSYCVRTAEGSRRLEHLESIHVGIARPRAVAKWWVVIRKGHRHAVLLDITLLPRV